MIDAIAGTFRTGSRWAHPPAKYGSWKGVPMTALLAHGVSAEAAPLGL